MSLQQPRDPGDGTGQPGHPEVDPAAGSGPSGYDDLGYAGPRPDQPGYTQPGYQPGYTQPGYQPGYTQPGYQPAVDEAEADDSGYDQPGYDDLDAEESGYGEPGYGHSGYGEVLVGWEDAPTRSLPRVARPAEVAVGVISPSRFDPVARVASQVAGGPAGSRLAPGRGFWRASTVLVLFGLLMMGLSVVQRQHCELEGWSTPDQFFHACYSDIPVLYSSLGLGGEGRPSLREAIHEGSLGPPLNAAAMWAVAWLVDDEDPVAEESSGKGAEESSGKDAKDKEKEQAPPVGPRRFFDLSVILLGAALVVTVVLVASVSGRRRWDAAHVALAPVVVTAGVLSYDLLPIMLMTGSLVAWARRKWVLAGVLLGAAAAAKPITAVVAVAVLAVALRAGRGTGALVFGGSAAVVWFIVRVALYGDLNAGLSKAWEVWRSGSPGYGSTWMLPQLFAQAGPKGVDWWYSGSGLNPTATTVATVVGVIAVLTIGVVLTLATRHRPRVAQVALLMTAGCLLVSRTVPIQASLVLLPLLAWAGLRWRDHLLWATAEVAYFVGTWLYIAAGTKPDRGLTAGFYLVLLLCRLAAIGWLGFQAGRAAFFPERDPVRAPEDGAPGQDDPLGGEIDEAPDSLVIRLA